MWYFIKTHKYVILVGILGLIAGAFLNYLANRITNKQLLQAITEQINTLQAEHKGSLSIEQQTQLIQLQAQQQLLKTKLGIS